MVQKVRNYNLLQNDSFLTIWCRKKIKFLW